jgi:hypothetical protein
MQGVHFSLFSLALRENLATEDAIIGREIL